MNRIRFPLEPGMQSDMVADLQDGLRFLLNEGVPQLGGRESNEFGAGLSAERDEKIYGRITQELVRRFQEQCGFEPNARVDERTAHEFNVLLEELGAFQQPTMNQQRLVAGQIPDTEAKTFFIEGQVVSQVNAGTDSLRVQVVDRSVGREVQTLAEGQTDDDGAYRVTFTNDELRRRGKSSPDLQARVYVGDKLIGASEIRYNATSHETLNVLLDGKASATLRSEHETLTGALSRHYPGNLGDLKETDDQQDITYLANKTGWDARAVALATLAEQFSARAQEAGAGIEPALFYALFRAGLPANEDALYQVSPETAESIWRQARVQGVVPASLEENIPTAVERFQTLAAKRLLDGPAPAGISSLKAMLSVSLGEDSRQHQRFADLYARHRGDPETLWGAVRDALGETAEKRLRLDGKLAFLTLNNAPLIEKLHAGRGAAGLTDPLELVEEGYYRAEKWREVVADSPLPPEVQGQDEDERRTRYSQLLAAQLRLSYPTAMVARMVKNKETLLLDEKGQPLADATVNDVHDFLWRHQGQFEIGMQPVGQYLQRNNLQPPKEVVRQIERIQRVYQITPSDEAMNALLKNGVDSAFSVARRDRDEFIRAYKGKLGGEANARLIHAKAQQAHNTVLNVALSYLTASAAPAVGAHSPAKFLDPAPTGGGPHASDVIAYATLENLWGEMDYCACEHCRSILSPAAYLVDLLSFLDKDDWPSLLTEWGDDYPEPRMPNGKLPYPFEKYEAWKTAKEEWDKANPGQPFPSAEIPLDVLLSRRPDIQHLPLTCDNTNKPLPYIDLVNEALEFFVANSLKFEDQSGKDFQGYSTGKDSTPEELAAAPEYAGNTVSKNAYKILAGVHFPPPLPFHQPLESLRRYFDMFEAPLPKVMADLRKNDNVERANVNEHGWRDILMEELRLSHAEYDLLTVRAKNNNNTDVPLTVRQLYGYPQTVTDAGMLEDLSNAKRFTRRVGITYEELVEILKTRFVNPNSILIPKLERLGVPFATLKKLKDGTITDQEFDGALSPHLDASQYGDDIKAWVKNQANYDNIMGLITLANPDKPDKFCSFSELEFRYANPDSNTNKVCAFEFVRLLRFIRLWKKLGWTVEQTDKAITALYPPGEIPNDSQDAVNLKRLDDGFLVLLPRLGAVKQIMEALKLKPTKDLAQLMACFAPIGTHGSTALYRQMFWRPALPTQDKAFADDGYGNVLDGSKKLSLYKETLRAAFGLTGEELGLITEELGFDANTALTIDNISSVFRHGWLARKLRLSVLEFLLLIKHTQIDPFATPDPANPPILRFIELVSRLRAASLKPEQALYLIWNQDISGKSAPSETEITAFAHSLRADLDAIEGEFAVVDDPDGKIARARMALVYGNETTDLFFGLLDNTLVTEVEYSHGQDTLAQAVLNAAKERLRYDDLRKQLSYTGVLTTVIRDAIKAVANVTSVFKNTVDKLYAENQKVIKPLFDRHPELASLYNAYIVSNKPDGEKRSDLLASFLPHLKLRRKRQQVLQAVSTALDAELRFAEAVLDKEYVHNNTHRFVLHAAGDANNPALKDFTALETPGLSARFYYSDTASGGVNLIRVTEAELAYSAEGNPLPANANNVANAISGIWDGYLQAPENGDYNFNVEAEAGSQITLAFGGKRIPMTQTGNLWKNQSRIELRAGVLYPISVKVEKVKNTLTIRWEAKGRGREVIPSRYLYSQTLIERLRMGYVRFLKAVSLVGVLKLTANELEHLTQQAAYQIDSQSWLNSLSVTGDPAPATSTALYDVLTALLDFALIKAELSPDDERLVRALRDPTAVTQNQNSLLLTLTRWEATSLNALLKHFGKVDGNGKADRNALKDISTFRRIHDAYVWVKKLGIPASALIEAATNEPDMDTTNSLDAALRARYAETDWLNVVKPINDRMRELQRDALVAYILHRMRTDPATEHIDTPDKLFEYFLMDVQMEPCMLTSRVRHALSSVQLFIERCLMNLEPRVAPSSINVSHWEWMKRYRVWEANRKVFLWPENWLEPELRDDSSPFFKETMSELLQSDITEDRATTALLNYLSKLDEVAKLEPCGIHYVEDDPNTKEQDEIAHVVARTSGANRKYYYRRCEYGYWTPWESIKLDIEDNPVLPVVWRGRLLLFWLRITQQLEVEKQKQPTQKTAYHSGTSNTTVYIDTPATTLAAIDPATIIRTDLPDVKVKVILCWSEYYNGQWKPTKTSNVNKPTELGKYQATGGKAFDRSLLTLSALQVSGKLWISVIDTGSQKMSEFVLYNLTSEPTRLEDCPDTFEGAYIYVSLKANGYAEAGMTRALSITDTKLTGTYKSWTKWLSTFDLRHDIIYTADRLRSGIMIPRQFDLIKPWEAPFFFYEDSRYAFYVTTRKDRVKIPNVSQYIPGPVFEKPTPVVPPLVAKKDPRIQPKVRMFPDIVTRPDIGVVDPVPMERFVSEDAYIRRAIGSSGVVRFGEREIGPAGSIKLPAKK